MTRHVSTVKWDGMFSVALPQEWAWSTDEGIVSMFRPDGVGVLQVSVLEREDRSQPQQAAAMQLARSFARQRQRQRQRQWDLPDREIRSSSVENYSITTFEFIEHGDKPTYWQVWHLVAVDRAAFITYTCVPADSEAEVVDRQRIVESFRWL